MAPEAFEALKQLKSLDVPPSLEETVRQRFKEPRRNATWAVAAVAAAAVVLTYLASSAGAPAGVPSAGAPVGSPIVAASAVQDHTTSTLRIAGQKLLPPPKASSQIHLVPATSSQSQMAPFTASPSVSTSIATAPSGTLVVKMWVAAGADVSQAVLVSPSGTEVGAVSPMPGGVSIAFPGTSGPWHVLVTVNGKVWTVQH